MARRTEKDLVIDKEFVLKTDLVKLRSLVFVEDSKGNRYRERIIDTICEMGVVEWFKLRGLPTDDNSVWKNRYCGSLTTLGENVNWNNGYLRGNLESQGYYLWENYSPIDIWTDEELFDKYKENPTLEKFGSVCPKEVCEEEEFEEEEEEEEAINTTLTAFL